MTDDRDQAWRPFDDADADPFRGRDGAPGPARQVDGPNRPTVSQKLLSQGKAIDESAERLDGLIGKLREFAGPESGRDGAGEGAAGTEEPPERETPVTRLSGPNTADPDQPSLPSPVRKPSESRQSSLSAPRPVRSWQPEPFKAERFAGQQGSRDKPLAAPDVSATAAGRAPFPPAAEVRIREPDAPALLAGFPHPGAGAPEVEPPAAAGGAPEPAAKEALPRGFFAWTRNRAKAGQPVTAEKKPSGPDPAVATADAGPRGTIAGDSVSRADAASPAEAIRLAVPGPAEAKAADMKARPSVPGMVTIEAERGPVKVREKLPGGGGPADGDKGRGGAGGGGGGGGQFHKRLGPIDFSAALKAARVAVKRNMLVVLVFTIASNILVLAIPIYLFQISDRVLTSRSVDTLVMLTVVIVGAVVLQAMFDAVRRFVLMRTAVEVAAQLGAPVLGAAARASLQSNGGEYQTLNDLQQLRAFLVSGTLLSFMDVPMAPLFILAIFLIHPHLGSVVVASSLLLLVVTVLNQRATVAPFGEANSFQSRANLHLDSMSRNSQIINALAMIPEAVRIWGKDTANSLKAQVVAQDRNIVFAACSRGIRLLTQVTMLGWGAYLAIDGHVTGGMVIAASIIAGRALGPIDGAIEGWNHLVQARSAYARIAQLLQASPLNFERLQLPQPEGRLDVERLLYVPQGTKRVVLNGVSFSLTPGDSLAIIGNSGAGKTTLGKMLVGSILPTSGNVRLDLMDLRNWDQRQFGENIGYLPQDVQLFPASIKLNIARMRDDATDAEIYEAAKLADVHEMISGLAQGYETFVASDGAPLSGGQKQRIALARAFFGNPRLVVLDEPNSNLDAAGDAALTRALIRAREQKITVVTITQRPALLEVVDKILVIANGTVALFGMRKDVLQALAARGHKLEGGPLGQIQ